MARMTDSEILDAAAEILRREAAHWDSQATAAWDNADLDEHRDFRIESAGCTNAAEVCERFAGAQRD